MSDVFELNKVATIDLEETPYLRPISNRGIGFYNMDKNTAQFQFIVKKNDKPLLISGNNVKGYAFFKAKNRTQTEKASTSGVLDVDYINPMKGIVGVTVPQWFLKNVVNSEVLGEIYLSLNDVSKKGKDDTVVLGTFSFEVKDALINQLESDIKVSYIRMFDDLKNTIESKVESLVNDIQSTTSMVDEVKQIIANAVKTINQTTDDSIKLIDDRKVSVLQDINKQSEMAITQINSSKDDVDSKFKLAQSSMQNDANLIIEELEGTIADANSVIDEKVNAFKNNGALTKDDVDSVMSSYDLQKAKLTDSNGMAIPIVDLDFNDPLKLITKSGLYYLYNSLNGPITSARNGMLWAMFMGSNYIKFIFLPYNSNEIYVRSKKGADNWLNWRRVDGFTDTGWNDLTVVNGTVPNPAYKDSEGFTSAFRIVNQNDVMTTYIRLNVGNVLNGQVIATLPKNVVNKVQSFPVATNGKPGCRVVILTTGDIVFYTSGITGEWASDDYIYSELRFTN